MKDGQLPMDKWEKTMDPTNVGGTKYCDEPSGAPGELTKSVDKLASYIKNNKFDRS